MKKQAGELINFNKELYPLKAIKAAQKAYGDLADFSLADKGKYIEVMITDIQPDVAENFKQEFCNYVLGLTAGPLTV